MMESVIQDWAAQFSAPPRTLIVEDDPFQRRQIEIVLRRYGFETLSVSDGEPALALCAQGKADLIVSDWQLERMSGPDLCRRVRALPGPEHPHFVLVTARDKVEDIVEGLDAGADDFLVKPWRTAELIARLRAGMRSIVLRRQLHDRSVALEIALQRQTEQQRELQSDIAAAARLQSGLLARVHSRTPEVLTTDLFRPATSLSGDLHGVLRLGDGRIGFYQLDTEGHGVPSALSSFFVASLLDALEAAPEQFSSPAAVVADLNGRVIAREGGLLCFTLVLGWFALATGEGLLCQAGHPHPLICDPDSGQCQIVGNGGLPVGMLGGVEYDDSALRIPRGARLVLHSDGIVDVENPEGEAWGGERLQTLLGDGARQPLASLGAAIAAALDRWQAGASAADDASLLIIERPASASPPD